MQQKQQPRPLGKRILRFLKGLVLVFVSAIAIILLALNFWLPNHIDDYRQPLETFISSKIQSPVSISSLRMQRDGLLPRVQINDLQITSPDGSDGLKIKNINASLSLTSLLLFKIQFSNLDIEKPEVYIHRRDDNSFWVAGIDITALVKNKPVTSERSPKQEIPSSTLWLLQQPSITLHDGLAQWTDQKNAALPLRLEDIQASLRSTGYTHDIKIEATPPPEFADRFTIQASLTEPALATATLLQNWDIDLHTLFPRIDVQNLYLHTPLPVAKIQGYGLAEGRAHYKNGQLVDSQVKLQIPNFEITARSGLPPIQLSDFSSTLHATWKDNALHLQSDNLTFHYTPQTNDSEHPQRTWANKSIDLTWQFDNDHQLSGGALKFADIDLETLSFIALSLPLPNTAQHALSEMKAQGLIDSLNIQWQGSFNALNTYSLQGSLSNLKANAGEIPPIPPGKKIALGRPGIDNLSLRFNLNETQGDVQLFMEDGSVTLPGLFDQQFIPIHKLQATAHLSRLENGQIKIDAPELKLITQDINLESKLGWLSPNPDDPTDTAGYFTMEGKLLNGQAAAVSRYLPNSIQPKVRTYLQAALISGEVPEATVTIHGPLADFPYHFKNTGVFLIKGSVQNATYDFAPSVIQPKLQAPWQVLDKVNGEMEITGRGMVIRNASGTIMNAPGSHFTAKEISIPNWTIKDTHVLISANIQGPANAILKTVNQSPIGQNLLKDLLSFANISGSLSTDLELDIMLDRIAESTVKGQIYLNNNTMSLWPFLPVLEQAKAEVSFTEKGFSATQIDAQALGGTVQGSAQLDLKQGLNVDLKGTYTAKGIFADANWGHQLLPDLKWLEGNSTYTFKATHENGKQIMRWESDLQGLEICLPEPMHKPAPTPSLLQITLRPIQSGTNQFLPLLIQVDTPESSTLPRFQAQYVLNKENAGIKITQGTIGINQTPVMPMTGTAAYVKLDRLNVPSWQTLLGTLPSTLAQDDPTRLSSFNLTLPVWWPQTTTADIHEFQIGDRFMAHDAQLIIQRQYDDWGAQITSKEIVGHVRWQARKPSTPNTLHANFSRLWLPSVMNGEERKQQTLIDQNTHKRLFALLPNTQLRIDDLRFGDKKLGALTLDAQIDDSVTPSRWRIKHLEIANDDSILTAHGYWANTLIPTTSLNLQIDLKDTGHLISQLGYEKILAAAPGKITGVLQWQNLPYAFEVSTLSGNLDIDLGKGQVLLADPGAGRLLSVLSLQALPSRLSLDFRDLFSKGLAFDTLKGQLSFKNGQLEVTPIFLQGNSAQVHVSGQVNLIDETQALEVIVLPSFDAIPVSLALATVNPPAGIGSLLAQIALKGPLQKASIRVYSVKGSWSAPEVIRDTHHPIFQNNATPEQP
ncbi:MAG: YhdP family protein [Saezia sp.]